MYILSLLANDSITTENYYLWSSSHGPQTVLSLPKYEAGVMIPVTSHYRGGQIEIQREDVAGLRSYCEGVAKAVSV